MDFLFDGTLCYSNGQVAGPRTGAGLSFVSSAAVPGAWRFQKAVCTSMTAALLAAVRREFRPLVMPLGHSIDIGSCRVTLFQAGTVPGGSGIFLENDGRRVMFCAAAPADLRNAPRCDTLVAFVTSARPATEPEVLATLVDSAKSAARAGMVPIVRCNQIGVARPACAALSAAGLRVRVHPAISRFNRVWGNHGHDSGHATGFRGGRADGVIVMPEHLATSPLESGIEHPWRICLTRAGCQCGPDPVPDQVMTLPGALTFNEIDALVARTGAHAVFVAGDGAGQYAATRQSTGFVVTVVDAVRQIELL